MSEPGAIICATLIMIFVVVCAILALCVAIAKKKPAPPAPPLLIIDPDRPELALTQDGRLVATPKARP